MISIDNIDTGLYSGDFTVGPESSICNDEGVFVCAANVPSLLGIKVIAVKVEYGVVTELGTPLLITDINYSAQNPILLLDRSTDTYILFIENGDWVTFSVNSSSLDVSKLNNGSLSTTIDYIYGAFYHSEEGCGVLCFANDALISKEVYFLTFSLSGGIPAQEVVAPTSFNDYILDVNVRVDKCGSSCIASYTRDVSPYYPKFRILHDIGTGLFDISAEFTGTSTGAYRLLGVSGDDNGNFLWHGSGIYVSGEPGISLKDPCYIKGHIEGTTVQFDDLLSYTPDEDVSYYQAGSLKILEEDTFVSTVKTLSDNVYIQKIKAGDIIDEISKEGDVSVNLYPSVEAFPSLSIDDNTGNCAAFYINHTDRYLYTLAFQFELTIGEFWTNFYYHNERDSGYLEKKPKATIIPSSPGQRYIPSTPDIPSKEIVTTQVAYACKKVG